MTVTKKAKEWEEYRERLEEKLKELWDSGTEDQKEFAKGVMKIRDKLIYCVDILCQATRH